MMKIFIFAFALTLLVTPASAYTCQDVRAFVAEMAWHWPAQRHERQA
jgi:hypothetical protein